MDGVEYEYYSINDTIVRLNGSHSYDANLYTHRFVREPHPGINNPVGEKALFIVGHNSSPLKMNQGYMEATITQIIDGRTASVEVPMSPARMNGSCRLLVPRPELAGKLHAVRVWRLWLN